MGGDDELKTWRDYRRLEPIAQLNDLLHQSDDSGWIATRELLAAVGWDDFHRLVVIMGDVRGGGGIEVLLPDETVAHVVANRGAYETCSVQEFADWDEQFAEPLWDAVVWLRHAMRDMLAATRSLHRSEDRKWQALRAFVESQGFDVSKSVIAVLGPGQHEEFGEFVSEDRRRFRFEIPYSEPRVSFWEEAPPDEERHPLSYRGYHFACWMLDAAAGKTSDWIFTRPYDWKDKIKPGWNPPFARPTYATAEDAALDGVKDGFVRVASVARETDDLVRVELDADDDPGNQYPMTVTCRRVRNGRWLQVRS